MMHNQYTANEYPDEHTTKLDFDRRIDSSGLFVDNFKEVSGVDLVAKPDQPLKKYKLDRVLVPTLKLINEGWKVGPFGVEVKGPDMKLGKPICQILDYMRSQFYVDGRLMRLRWCFLWPLHGVGGDIGSVMAQNCVGYGYSHARDNGFSFMAGGAILIRWDGESLRVRNPVSGKKLGSR